MSRLRTSDGSEFGLHVADVFCAKGGDLGHPRGCLLFVGDVLSG